MKETNQRRYGADFHWMTDEGKAHRIESFKTNFGVEHPFFHPIIKQKLIDTNQQRYGVSYPLQSATIRKKTYESYMSHNKVVGTSQVENKVYQALQKRFSPDDIERGKPIMGWVIDLYVVSVDTFIQVDGVYWHGLDRPISEIEDRASKGESQAKSILDRIQRDKVQNAVFANKGKRLIRISDVEVSDEDTLNAFISKV
jgi:hypothetical protein